MELRDEFRKEINMFGSVQNVDYYDAEPIDVWAMTAGELIRIPQYYRAIHTYSDTLSAEDARNCFYYDFSLAEWEIAMRIDMGGGLPVVGFYEMKQEVYEISHRLLGDPS